jgi:hypothetical protein
VHLLPRVARVHELNLAPTLGTLAVGDNPEVRGDATGLLGG